MNAIRFPDFFADAPRIVVRDPLADFLGVAEDGIVEYTYADVVKLAGHSCPTVASAFLMTRAALAALYPDALPERGGVRIELPQAVAEGVSGVLGAVVGMITGAAGKGGFHRIGPRFDRCALLAFGVSGPAQLRASRMDSGAAVSATVRTELIPGELLFYERQQRLVVPRDNDVWPEALTGGQGMRARPRA